ncbi:hypothetical protein IPM09_04560 [Candidatus Saccharibacteria bacterium]|nr:MAG: hypothetical protein IPM09_04560 [Candidatus Saccharibacteria bacterium]
MLQTEKRVVVVHNPLSTRAAKIQAGVFNQLDAAGVHYEPFLTKYPDTEANIDDMRNTFQDGDIILSAGGDGTAMQISNAVLREGHTNTLIGPLGYGNFRDLGKEQNPLQLLDSSAHVVDAHPMTIETNGRYLRDAPGYMTLGFTAMAASRFGASASRERMRNLPEWTKLAASIGQLGMDYFELRDRLLPAFHTSQSPLVQNAVTDILAINSRQVGRIIRSSTDYPAGSTFGFRTNNVSSIMPNIPFGLRALAGRAPAHPTNHLTVYFEQPSVVPFQTEGEYDELHDVTELFVYKDPAKVLHLLRPGTSRRQEK